MNKTEYKTNKCVKCVCKCNTHEFMSLKNANFKNAKQNTNNSKKKNKNKKKHLHKFFHISFYDSFIHTSKLTSKSRAYPFLFENPTILSDAIA